MAELVHERSILLTDSTGTTYDRARVYAERERSTWAGWIEFVSTDDTYAIRTGRETTQSHIEGVAYWATGLELVYFEGAFDRAFRRTAASHEPTVSTPEVEESAATEERHAPGGHVVHLRIETMDPVAPLQLMRTRTLVPGQRRWIKDSGVIVYQRTARAPSDTEPGAYEFLVQFGSENAAALMANTLWNDLHGLGARLLVEGEEVGLTNATIKDALLAATAA